MRIDQTRSDFDQMQYQTQVVSELTTLVQTQKIPNALLFLGNEHTGKKRAAFFFAKGCNCSDNEQFICNTCRSCRKIEAQTHPDIICVTLLEEKKMISISQIREIGMTISSRPNEARFRMVMICAADQMNPQAQNALLKMLEEPPEKTFFVLIAQKISFLLPTIISRCRIIRFKPLTDKFIARYLITEFQIDSQMARIAAKTADSDLKKAMMYVNLNSDDHALDWIKTRPWLINTLADIIRSQRVDSTQKGLLLSQRLSENPLLADDAIAVMKTFFRDLIVFQFHPEKIVNLDFLAIFKDIGQMIETHITGEWIKDLYETEKRMTSNSTLRLTLDRFFLKLAVRKGNMIYD